MGGINDFIEFMNRDKDLVAANRPLRLRLAHAEHVSDDMLLPQTVIGAESVCGGLEYRVLCVSTSATLPLKELIALPAAIEFVTDRGALRSICGIVAQASAGDSDGGLATYQLVLRDAMAIMEKRVNTRVFRNMSEVDIVSLIVAEWRHGNPVLAGALEFELDELFDLHPYPAREFTMQHNESDAAFVRRLLRRRGIAWHFRAGRARDSGVAAQHDEVPAHTFALFNHPDSALVSAAGTVRYHRDHATEQRDTISAWRAVRTLQAGSVGRHSWDYLTPLGGHFMMAEARGGADQGGSGNELAASLDDYQVQMPHAGDDHEDLCRLGQLGMARHDYDSKCFHGEGSVRDMGLNETFSLTGHPEIDTHAPAEREFVVTALRLHAHNNLPRELAAKVERLFARNRWLRDGPPDTPFMDGGAGALGDGPVRMRMQFTAVRRGVAIVPAYDPATDQPTPPLQSALVVGPPGETVHCDRLGRVKIRFPGTRARDHAHAQGAGAADADGDSAWVRVASNWAGNGPGSLHQCGALTLPRVGTEVLVAFMGGPDKPVVLCQMYNQQAQPPALSCADELPGARHLSGMKSREIDGQRANQLRFDDNTGRINAQLASDHAAAQLNLGWLSEPTTAGHGRPRGEGAELRSDKAVAVRGAQGVLISAGGGGAQLERAELIGVAEALHGVAEQLGRLAGVHAGDAADGPELARLLGALRHWHQGSNTAPGKAGGGAAIVAASAPAGMLLASQDNMLLGAESKIDVVSAGDTQLSSGRSLYARAARGLTLFAHSLGAKLIAAGGNVVVQAHDGDIELTATGRIRLTAGTLIELQAPQIKLVAEGAQTDHGGGAITQQCGGGYAVKSATFAHVSPGGGAPPGVAFPDTKIETDERIILYNPHTGLPIEGRRYKLKLENGNVVEGITDQQGRTELVSSDSFGKVEITVYPDDET